MSSIYFEYPLSFVIMALFFVCLKLCPKKEDSLLFSTIKFLKKSSKKFSLTSAFKLLTILFLFTALASPYTIKKAQIKEKNSISIVLDIDISGSMEESFESVKKELLSFINSQKNSKLAVVFFANSPLVASPLTYDGNYVKEVVKLSKVGDLGNKNTTINDSLILSAKLLKKSDSKKKVLLLLTDGVERGSKNSFSITKEFLKKKKFDFFAVGFGEDYDKRYLEQFTKNVIDAKDIKKLKKSLKDISSKYKSKRKVSKDIKIYLFQYPLFFAFLSLLFYTYLINKRALV